MIDLDAPQIHQDIPYANTDNDLPLPLTSHLGRTQNTGRTPRLSRLYNFSQALAGRAPRLNWAMSPK